MWADTRVLELFGIDLPIIQAPMAGSDGPQLAAAVSAAGGLGSIACAMLTPQGIVDAVRTVRERTDRPFNLNFFCHPPPKRDPAGEATWIDRLRPYYDAFGAVPPAELTDGRAPFSQAACDVVEQVRPAVASFHFGLPEDALLDRVRATGCRIISSATTPEEAEWLAARGVDAVIAQGAEAGGHRGVFLEDWRDGSGMVGTMALVPQVVDAVAVPVIAAGGIADGRAVAAAMALGASAVQVGTAYLFTPDAATRPAHRAALATGRGDRTAVTNVITGRPARTLVNRLVRETGPIAPGAPDFPLAASASQPLAAAAGAEAGDFASLWAGQSVGLGREMPAGDLTLRLAEDARAAIARLATAI